jgi:ABC-type spermidine/putrescine transport system permease subunit II
MVYLWLCSFSLVTLSPGPPSVKMLFLAPVLKPNIVLSLRLVGYVNSYWNFDPPFTGAFLSIVTTSVTSIYPPIQFNITV